jgi:hypothetical protein
MTMRVVTSRFPLKKSQRQKHDLVTVTKTAFLVAKELSITTVCSGSLIYLLDQWGVIEEIMGGLVNC